MVPQLRLSDWELILHALQNYGRPGGEIRARANALSERIEDEILPTFPPSLPLPPDGRPEEANSRRASSTGAPFSRGRVR